jgi:hypothetical protein
MLNGRVGLGVGGGQQAQGKEEAEEFHAGDFSAL